MVEQAKLRVYTDGACAFCWWARGFVEPHDSDHRIDFRDFNQQEIAAETPFAADELAREIHVQTPDGRWHAGFWGWIAILRVLPHRRWLARLMSMAPLRWIGPLVYRLLAGNRYRLPAWFLRIIGAPQQCRGTCAVPVGVR